MKKNLPDWKLNRDALDPQPSTYPLSYRAMDINDEKIYLYISPWTLDQYWSTLVLFYINHYSNIIGFSIPTFIILNVMRVSKANPLAMLTFLKALLFAT